MNCSHFEEQIAWAVSDDLAPTEKAQLDAHLDQCAACREFAADMATSHEVLGSLGSVALPAAALTQVRQQLSQHLEAQSLAPRQRVFNMASLRWAALVAMALSAWWWLPIRLQDPVSAPEVSAPAASPATSVWPPSVATVATVAESVPETDSFATKTETPNPAVRQEPRVSESPEPLIAKPEHRARLEPTPTSSPTALAAPSQSQPFTTPAAGEPVAVLATAQPQPSTQLQASKADSPKTASNEPMVVHWISEDPDLVIYWLVDTEPEEENPNVPSKV